MANTMVRPCPDSDWINSMTSRVPAGSRPGGGLVQEQDLGIVQQGSGQRHPLALSGGEALGEVVGPVGHAEPFEQLVDPPIGLGPAEAPEPGGEHQVLPAGQAIVEPGVLGEHARASAHLVALGHRVESGHPGPAVVRRQHAVEQAHGGGLAGAVGSEQGQHLARARR